ncbi:cytochrome P450 [Polyporus arcularius HHB13444]|uniref:Cytochrome P450 n=1 Tax=Polyporus arcularius HHB13444 TaxID=1314778 RepID=A0A5C3PUG4_9APHY|nr:cytochrome P450 [Polyporus arcularius HHB13444]
MPVNQVLAAGTLVVGVGAFAAAIYLLAQFARSLGWGQHAGPLPPGPPGHWLFGNLPPTSFAYRYYTELAGTYGPVFTMRYGSHRVCVITGHQAAMDIMVKQSHKLIDRPRYVAAGEIISAGMRTLLTRAGDRLRRLRSSLHAALQPQVSAKYEPIQTHNALNYILDLLDDPDKHLEHAKRYAASVIMTVTYGKTTPTSYSDPEVQRIGQGAARLGSALRPGAYLVDTYPFLRYIPGFTSELQRYHEEEKMLYRSQVGEVKERQAKNEINPCFVTYLLEQQEESGLSDDELAYLAGSMFGAGSDTTAGVLGFLTMASARYPEAQRRAQAQLDAVVGRDRLPTSADQDSLPEVWAYIEELYRWRPVVPSGISHSATQDIIWKDYVIPAGTEVVGCHWAIARDPEVFPDGEEFKPTRWLDDQGRLKDDLKFFNWGFGRRVCPGQHLADRSVFINTALVLWAFEISEDPKHPIDTLGIMDGALAHPEPFVARFKPRVPDLREKIALFRDSME